MSLSGKVADAKGWWQSRTIIATIVGLLGGVAEAFFGVSVADLIDSVWVAGEQFSAAADQIWFIVQEQIAFATAWWFRVKATLPIKSKTSKK